MNLLGEFELARAIRDDSYKHKERCTHSSIEKNDDDFYLIGSIGSFLHFVSYCPNCGIDLSTIDNDVWNKRFDTLYDSE